MWNTLKDRLIFWLIRHTRISTSVIYAALAQRSPNSIKIIAEEAESEKDASLANYYRPVFNQLPLE